MSLRVIMDSGEKYIVDENVSEFCDIIMGYNSLSKSEFLKMDLVRIGDGTILINPSKISSIEEIQVLYNLSRNCLQEKISENKEIQVVV